MLGSTATGSHVFTARYAGWLPAKSSGRAPLKVAHGAFLGENHSQVAQLLSFHDGVPQFPCKRPEWCVALLPDGEIFKKMFTFQNKK